MFQNRELAPVSSDTLKDKSQDEMSNTIDLLREMQVRENEEGEPSNTVQVPPLGKEREGKTFGRKGLGW